MRCASQVEWHWIFALFCLLILCFPSNVSSGGPVLGSRAAAMGTAFVAVADDPSAIAINPAGLTILTGTNLYGGGTAVIPRAEYTSPSGVSQDTEFQVFFPPHLYMTTDFKLKDLAFGLGLYCPFGIGGMKWSETGLTRYASTGTLISTYAVNPVFAWKVQPWLSIGGGFYYMRANTQMERMVDQSMLGATNGKLSLKGDGGGWGYNVGVMLFPEAKVSLGFAYRSQSKVNQNMTVRYEGAAPQLQPLLGGSTFRTDASSSLAFPQAVSMGIAFRPTQSWTLSLEGEWYGWSSFQSMNLNLQNEVPEAGLSDSSIPFNFKSGWMLKAGAEYKVNESLSLRAGYSYVMNRVPEQTLSPGNPESDQYGISIGLGYRIKKVVIDCFYMAAFYERRGVGNDILNGKYVNFSQALGASVGYRF